ncbi:serine/threonine-protein kinase TTK/MPS1 [Nematocida displodere]|uniref:Serine/threonine-protein kinase TTK/MPS1 n=1 Tax=Nematocida displodere TaxID=1805483 RepID=A0A177EHK9_9MICR|nr:serine/threonine-protein kinase TTK/MPS1 [Nematocida displodere]
MERLFRIEDILDYIEEQKSNSASLTRQLSMYYEATQKNLEVSEKTLLLWQEYINLLESNGYTETEIREVYKMLKSRYWKLKNFWSGWLDYESRLPPTQSKRAKVLETARDMLKYKDCEEKEAILQWIDEKSLRTRDYTDTRLLYPNTPKSTIHIPTTYTTPTTHPTTYTTPTTHPTPTTDTHLGYTGIIRSGEENRSNHILDPGCITGSIFDAPIKITPSQKQPDNVSVQDTNLQASAHKKITLNGRKLRILRTIGKGGSGKVYQVLSDKNEVFALKKIKLPTGSESDEVHRIYVNEIEHLKKLRHRHEIVTLKDSYVNKDRIAILMEYGDIDLSRFLEIERTRVPEGYRKSRETYMLRNLWEQMVRAVKCIHDHRIVHRDLKPANFLFVAGRLKLIDFGISKEIRNDTTNILREKQIGTINYMPPEAIIEGKTKMGRSSDIWSLGCILYEMYFGEAPFVRFKSLVQRMQKLLDPEYTVECPPEETDDQDYPEVLAEIHSCLQRDPQNRVRIDDLLAKGLCTPHSTPQTPHSTLQTPHSTPQTPQATDPTCAFTKEELGGFISKIMDMKHTAPTPEGKLRIVEKISNLYFNKRGGC